MVSIGLALIIVSLAHSSQAKYQSYVTKGLLCIHSYEGPWDDPDAPYWGGLQMDMSFQKTYGYRWVGKGKSWGYKVHFNKEWGTADHWPIWAQMMAGRHGYFSRGWYPWYNTARKCGLI